MSRPISDSTSNSTHSTSSDQLIQLITPWITPLGYQIIYLEIQSHRQKTLRIYIDFLDSAEGKSIGIEDCVKVSRGLEDHLDQDPKILALLADHYELEVSSPGVDRPLRTSHDFQRFAGQEVRIHVYRPMTGEELSNATYQAKNPKQKNFKGTLVGLQENKVILSLSSHERGSQRSGNQKINKKSMVIENAKLTTNSEEGITLTIPLPLISKANLEPEFNFEGCDERE